MEDTLQLLGRPLFDRFLFDGGDIDENILVFFAVTFLLGLLNQLSEGSEQSVEKLIFNSLTRLPLESKIVPFFG